MSDPEYLRAVADHREVYQALLADTSPRVRAFMETHFRLDLYPAEWIRKHIAALEELASPVLGDGRGEQEKET